MAGAFDRLKVLVRMKGNRDAVSLLVTGGSSCSGTACLPEVGITSASKVRKAASTSSRSRGAELLGLVVGLGRDQAAGKQSDAIVVAEIVDSFPDPFLHVDGRFDR